MSHSFPAHISRETRFAIHKIAVQKAVHTTCASQQYRCYSNVCDFMYFASSVVIQITTQTNKMHIFKINIVIFNVF